MPETKPKSKPGFFWQGVLILLPVAIMCVLGARTIVVDRATVEKEMLQQADLLLKQMNRDFAVVTDSTTKQCGTPRLVASIWPSRCTWKPTLFLLQAWCCLNGNRMCR